MTEAGAHDIEIRIKRVYSEPTAEDGTRVLVDRMWPQGLRKERARLDCWDKELGPSKALRKWFAHDPQRWREFRHRYFSELDSKPEAVHKLLEIAQQQRPVTLVYASRDVEHNNARALKDYLYERLQTH